MIFIYPQTSTRAFYLSPVFHKSFFPIFFSFLFCFSITYCCVRMNLLEISIREVSNKKIENEIVSQILKTFTYHHNKKVLLSNVQYSATATWAIWIKYYFLTLQRSLKVAEFIFHFFYSQEAAIHFKNVYSASDISSKDTCCIFDAHLPSLLQTHLNFEVT